MSWLIGIGIYLIVNLVLTMVFFFYIWNEDRLGPWSILTVGELFTGITIMTPILILGSIGWIYDRCPKFSFSKLGLGFKKLCRTKVLKRPVTLKDVLYK